MGRILAATRAQPPMQRTSYTVYTAGNLSMIESNLDPWPVQALEATLGLPTARTDAPVDLPPLWHWLYFLPTAPRSSIGPDGHMVNQEWVDSSLRRCRLFAAALFRFLCAFRIRGPGPIADRRLRPRRKHRTGRRLSNP